MSSTSFFLFNALVWILLVTTGDSVALSRGGAILRRLATSSSLRVKPILADGQQSCSKGNPCNVQISGYSQHEGIASTVIDLKAGESWNTATDNALYFKETDYDQPGQNKPIGFVEYFFIGYYDNALNFVWYDKNTYDVNAGRIEEAVVRSKVITAESLIGLCEGRKVAREPYWQGIGYGAKIYWRLIIPATTNTATTTTAAGDTTASGSSRSSLRVKPISASGQQPCTKAKPCSIEISGYSQYEGIASTVIDLKAGESWSAMTDNALYFKETDYDQPGQKKPIGFVEYFFIGYYDNALNFVWYDKTYDVNAGRIGEAVVRSKVITAESLIDLCEERKVAREPYWHGIGYGAKIYWRLIMPQTNN